MANSQRGSEDNLNGSALESQSLTNDTSIPAAMLSTENTTKMEQHPLAEMDGSDDTKREYCRDFLKNICNRGTKCKFYHPPDLKPQQESEEINFCLDYQNKGCTRDNCRYVHGHREDADHYRRTGEVTHALARAIAAVSTKDTINGIPFCKEFLSANCSRGNRCRYWHINPVEERERRFMGAGGYSRDVPMRGGGARGRGRGGGASHEYYGGRDPYGPQYPQRYDYEDFASAPKRGRYDENGGSSGGAASPRYVAELERKNADLMRENEDLKRELKRQNERYEDLYLYYTRGPPPPRGDAVVITQQMAPAQVAVSAPAFVPAAIAAPVLTSAAASVGQAQPSVPAPIPPPAAAALAAVELVSMAQQASNQMAATPLQQSIAISHPSDIIAWSSTMNMHR